MDRLSCSCWSCPDVKARDLLSRENTRLDMLEANGLSTNNIYLDEQKNRSTFDKVTDSHLL